MTFALVLIATALFFLSLERLGVVALSYRVVAESSGALKIIANSDLDDDVKEAAIRRRAIGMMGLLVQMLVRVLAVLLIPAALVYAGVLAGATDAESIWRVSTSWPLLLTNVAILACVLVWRRKS